MRQPLASVVMVARNELRNLRQSLPLILDQETPFGYDVLIIDSSSTDGTREYLSGHADERRLRVLTIRPGEFHHARTRNLGAAMTSGRIIVFLGGDAIPTDRQWLQKLVAPVIAGDAVGSFGRQLPRPDADQANRCRIAFNYGASSMSKSRQAALSPRARYFFSSANCCLDRRVVRDRPFDESFAVNEDVALAKRLIDSGETLAYVADATVVHSHNYSFGQIFRRSFDNGRVYRRLRIFDENDRHAAADGARYLRMLAGRTLQTRPMALPTAITFFVASALGFQMGLRYERMPRSIGLRLSMYPDVE
jgi:rhamnosyltransferase